MYTGGQQGRAEEAVNYYTAQFPDSCVNNIVRYEPGEECFTGKIKHAGFIMSGLEFAAMDGDAQANLPFTPGVSLFVNCETQEEVDLFWEKLSEGGHKDRCGWLQDKFGVSWQIVPATLHELMRDPDPVKSKRVFDAMMKMTKLRIEGLREAYNNNSSTQQ